MRPADDLRSALRSVADVERAPSDPAADLARARSAAAARTRRRLRLALGGVATAAVLAAGAGVVLDSSAPVPDPVTAQVRLVAEPFEAAPYTFGLTPEGWSVQDSRPTAVTIVPDDGSTSDDPSDFEGKLVILFDANPPAGRALERGSRTFWVVGDSGYTSLATRTRPGEPAGVVRIQYPVGTGWDLDSMVAFLASVEVGPGARRGVG
ncbi:hypothetical protein GCM10027062_44240 [Nocardioides hungaricus]